MSSPCVNECFHSNCEGPRWYCGKKRGWRDISQQMSSATQWHFEAFPLAFDLHYARYHYSQDIASQCLCICSFGDSAATKTLPILCCPHSLPELCLLPVLVFTLAITMFSMQKSWFVEETQRNPYQWLMEKNDTTSSEIMVGYLLYVYIWLLGFMHRSTWMTAFNSGPMCPIWSTRHTATVCRVDPHCSERIQRRLASQPQKPTLQLHHLTSWHITCSVSIKPPQGLAYRYPTLPGSSAVVANEQRQRTQTTDRDPQTGKWAQSGGNVEIGVSSPRRATWRRRTDRTDLRNY